MQGPLDLTLAASAARTADATMAPTEFVDLRVMGVIATIDITVNAGGSGSVTLTIEGFDIASGKWYTILSSAALTAVATTVIAAYPGANAVANSRADMPMPRKFRVRAVANNANPVTYSVGCTLLPRVA